MASVAEHPVAKVDDEGHEDLVLSAEEQAQEYAEAAARRERDLGGSTEAQDDAYGRAYDEKLKAVQAEQASPSEEPQDPSEGTSEPSPSGMAVVGPNEKGVKDAGKQPTHAFLLVKGMKIEVPEGNFAKGERLRFEGEILLTGRAVKDKLDKHTLTAVDCFEAFEAQVIDFQLTDED